MPVERHLAADPKFRSVGSVKFKLGNFRAIDSHGGAGLQPVSATDREVFDEWVPRSPELRDAANAIRAAVAANASPPAAVVSDDPDVSEAPEGTLLTGIHVRRERSAKLVAAKKARALAETGKLACEACGFDFYKTYGPGGDGVIECHHTKPVHTLRAGQRTKLEDLALVCANCHRVIHRRKQWLTMDELRALLHTAGA
jgi:5-methylcytosine-specific restriction enzyme A